MNASRKGPPVDHEDAAQIAAGRERMLARHKLIEGMIRNNELQLKNESQRGGAEIERECALRDAGLPGAGIEAASAVAAAGKKLALLEEEHRRLVSEREWLNVSLLEFESGASPGEHKRAGHA